MQLIVLKLEQKLLYVKKDKWISYRLNVDLDGDSAWLLVELVEEDKTDKKSSKVDFPSKIFCLNKLILNKKVNTDIKRVMDQP